MQKRRLTTDFFRGLGIFRGLSFLFFTTDAHGLARMDKLDFEPLERVKKCYRRKVVWASSPSSVLRTPSPPLGEKAGMRGYRPTLHGHMLIETATVLLNPL
jgi:hypothetical protein